MFSRRCCLAFLTCLAFASLCLTALPSLAQALDLAFGVTAHGQINDDEPRVAYAFDGLRGDVVSLSLQVTGGTLEPMLLLADSKGNLINLPDEQSGRDIRLSSILLPTTDRYSIIVVRFGDRQGTTSGDYALTLTRVGVSSDQGSVLRYGDSVFNTINNATPQVFYTFLAARGDIITVQMQRTTGNLDSTLQLVNDQSEVIAENDDQPDSNDAAISGYTIRDDGVYVIIASRYGGIAGQSQGQFVLTLSSASESGLGASVEFALPLEPDTPLRGSITNARNVQFYRFAAHKDDRVSVRMDRKSGDLDALLVIADSSGRELIEDDDTGGGQNAAILDFAIPADGTYLVLAMRYERAQGTTQGDYELTLSISNR